MAESVSYRAGSSEDPHTTVKVFLGPQGKRLEGVPPRGLTVISPRYAPRRFLLDANRGLYAVDPSKGKGKKLGGLLAREPCRGFPQATQKGARQYRGLAVEEWQCHHPAFGTTSQLYAPDLGVVVRDETEEGKVQELRSFQFRSPDPELFRFPEAEDWEEVPVMDLFQSRD